MFLLGKYFQNGTTGVLYVLLPFYLITQEPKWTGGANQPLQLKQFVEKMAIPLKYRFLYVLYKGVVIP